MKFEVPDDLHEDFMSFLDVMQASFTEEEVDKMTDNEKKLIIWLDSILGEGRTTRFKTQDEFAMHIANKFKDHIGMDDSDDAPKED